MIVSALLRYRCYATVDDAIHAFESARSCELSPKFKQALQAIYEEFVCVMPSEDTILDFIDLPSDLRDIIMDRMLSYLRGIHHPVQAQFDDSTMNEIKFVAIPNIIGKKYVVLVDQFGMYAWDTTSERNRPKRVCLRRGLSHSLSEFHIEIQGLDRDRNDEDPSIVLQCSLSSVDLSNVMFATDLIWMSSWGPESQQLACMYREYRFMYLISVKKCIESVLPIIVLQGKKSKTDGWIDANINDGDIEINIDGCWLCTHNTVYFKKNLKRSNTSAYRS
jgi:hypothetical protein